MSSEPAAAAAIRRFELENDREAIPIIALTGHALKGKEQESLDAGRFRPLRRRRRRLLRYGGRGHGGADPPIP